MQKSQRKYHVIQSKPIKDPTCEEMACLLTDLDEYTDSQIKDIRKLSFMIGMLKKYTRDELFAIAGHCDWLLKNHKS